MSSSRQSRSQKKMQEECTTVAKKFNWADLPISEELVEFGKSLQELAASDLTKLSKSQLSAHLTDLSKSYIHAVSQESAPREEADEEAEKDEARVANRAANAASAAKAKGLSDADREVLMAEAAAKEREKLAAKAKEAEERAAAKVREAEEAKKQALADAAKKAADRDAQHAQELAAKEAESQATRARMRALETANNKLKQQKDKSVEDHAEQPHEEDGDDESVQHDAKRRKTAAERKEEYIAEHGNDAWELKEETRKRNAQTAKKKKEEAAKAKILAECAEDGTEYAKLKRHAESLKQLNQEYKDIKDKDNEQFNALKHKKRKLTATVKKLVKLAESKGATHKEIGACKQDEEDMEVDA